MMDTPLANVVGVAVGLMAVRVDSSGKGGLNRDGMVHIDLSLIEIFRFRSLQISVQLQGKRRGHEPCK